jgi:hypothetical protein
MIRKLRFLAPFALAAFVASPSHADGDSKPFDASLPRPFMMSMRGATASEAWVTMQERGLPMKPLSEGVVDLKTGCVTETMPPFNALRALTSTHSDPFAIGNTADVTKQAEAKMADAATKADIVRFVAAGRRFNERRLGFNTFSNDGIAFSGDGKTIALEVAEAVFRSSDSGQSFDRLDQNMSRYPQVTADGKWVVYERCGDPARRNQSCPDTSREVRIVAADNSTAAKTLTIGSGLLRGLDPTGQKLVVVRYDMGNEVTVMHVDPSTGLMTRAFGIPSTAVQKNRFHDINPSARHGQFGLFDDNDVVPTNVLTVVSMTTGAITQKFTVSREMATETDDETGRVLWQTYPDDHAWARKPGGSTIDLGMGDPLGWAPGGRALVFNAKYSNGARASDPPGTLGTTACKLVRVVPVN